MHRIVCLLLVAVAIPLSGVTRASEPATNTSAWTDPVAPDSHRPGAYATTVAATDPVAPERVRTLVRQLADAQLSVRNEAEQQLLGLGTGVLEHLPTSIGRMPAEMQQRIERIRQQLERQQAKATVDASRVTLSARKQPLSSVLKSLEDQTGNRVADYRDFRGQPVTDLPITLDLKDVPYWEALDRIFDEAGLTTYGYAMDDEGEPLRAISMVARELKSPARRGIACYEGPFRFEPTSLVARRSLREAAGSALVLEIEAAWEPRLTPIAMRLKVDSIRALDDQGKPLMVRGRGESEIEVYGTATSFPIRFALPSREAKSIQQLQGEIDVLVPARIETFRFDALMAGPRRQKTLAGATVILDQARKNRDVWEVRLRVQLESTTGKLESHQLDWVLRNEAYLVDAAGKRVEPATIEKTREVENEFGMAYLFGIDGDLTGYTFVYKTPASLLVKKIPFRFRDIALP